MFLSGFANIEDVGNQFEIDMKGINIVIASYDYRNYDGRAFVLFEQDGMFFEVNASHCSCYGLEGQWEPEEVSWDELQNRLLKGNLGTYAPRDELEKIILKQKLIADKAIEA